MSASAPVTTVPPVIAALRERLKFTDEEVRALVAYASEGAVDVGVFDGYEWDPDAFHEWLTEEVWAHASPSDQQVRRVQKTMGWSFDA